MRTERDRTTGGGLASQVKPTFMVPAVGMSAFGGLLSPSFDPFAAALHALAVGTALYTAHLVDEYVDAYVRQEDAPSVAEVSLKRAIAGGSAACLALAGVLVLSGRGEAAGSVAVLWVLAVLHAPVLDRNTVAVTVDYPVGIAVALVGGSLAQRSTLPPDVVGIAAVFVVVLAAVKVSIDRLDREYDTTIDKRTVPVVLGERRARRVSAALFGGAGGVVGTLVVGSVLPVSALLSVPFLFVGAAVGLGDAASDAVTRQMLLVYPAAAVLFGAQCLADECVAATAVFGLLG